MLLLYTLCFSEVVQYAYCCGMYRYFLLKMFPLLVLTKRPHRRMGPLLSADG